MTQAEEDYVLKLANISDALYRWAIARIEDGYELDHIRALLKEAAAL